MPYEEGSSLRERLARDGPLPIEDVVLILRDVCDALAHAHQRGIVHRDIKPDNVLLAGRHALVTDFGVARGAAEATTTRVTFGTPAYMAPEQIAVTTRSIIEPTSTPSACSPTSCSPGSRPSPGRRARTCCRRSCARHRCRSRRAAPTSLRPCRAGDEVPREAPGRPLAERRRNRAPARRADDREGWGAVVRVRAGCAGRSRRRW